MDIIFSFQTTGLGVNIYLLRQELFTLPCPPLSNTVFDENAKVIRTGLKKGPNSTGYVTDVTLRKSVQLAQHVGAHSHPKTPSFSPTS